MIELFTASAEATQPGRPVTLCYIVRGADSVRIEPGPGALERPDKSCVTVTPQRTTTYTLAASGGGKSEREHVTIRVP